MLSWLQKGEQDVYALIARKNYPKAIRLLEEELRADPQSVHLRQLLADVLTQADQKARAVGILQTLVDELAAEGFEAKAIAVLKKIQRLDPQRPDVEQKLAALILQREMPAVESQIPLVRAHQEETPATSPLTSTGIADVGFPTSEYRADWFEEAVEERQDFHWSPLLAGFYKDELAALIGGLQLLVKNPGAIIYGEDEPGESLFILASGRARVYRRNGIGHYEQVGMLQDGDFFGEASVLTVSNRRSTVIAATECELLELDKETFEGISKRYPRVSETIRRLHEKRSSHEAASGSP